MEDNLIQHKIHILGSYKILSRSSYVRPSIQPTVRPSIRHIVGETKKLEMNLQFPNGKSDFYEIRYSESIDI